MNNESYSAYADEAEFIIVKACEMLVLAVEHDVKIVSSGVNNHMQKYND